MPFTNRYGGFTNSIGITTTFFEYAKINLRGKNELP